MIRIWKSCRSLYFFFLIEYVDENVYKVTLTTLFMIIEFFVVWVVKRKRRRDILPFEASENLYIECK